MKLGEGICTRLYDGWDSFAVRMYRLYEIFDDQMFEIAFREPSQQDINSWEDDGGHAL